MQKFSTWMILLLAIIFWGVRVIACYYSQMGDEFMVTPLDFNLEVFLLFITVLCFVLIAKRKWLGAILYLVAYEGYFGVDIFNTFMSGAENLSIEQYSNMMFSIFGIILPIFVLFDMIFDTNRKLNPRDKKTDWFYRNKNFDRQMDDRSDKNNYRTL